jgi:FixJ family two-component response regulator
VENGEDALKLLNQQKFTCLISDVRMPKIDGMSLLEKLTEQGIETPVIMMTGFSEYSEAEVAKKGGAVLLEKPFNRAKLKELVEDYIMMLPDAS